MRRLIRNHSKDDFLNMHSGLLALVMGDINIVRPVRESLVGHGLIECDYEYAAGKKSFGMRIGPALADRTWREFTSDNKRFSKRVAKFKAHLLGDKLDIPIRTHLKSWCKRVEFSASLDDVLATLPETPYEVCEWDNKRQMADHQVNLIRSGYFSFRECDDYGRFHSNFTSLCGELRRCLVVDDVPLVEIDIVNSQPYFLSTILLEVFLSGGQNAPSLPRLLHNSSQDHSSLFSSFHHASNYLQNGEEEEREEEGDKTQPYDSGLRAILNLPVPLDLQMMVQKTSEGKFYETFVQESDKLTRDQVKRKLFQTIFGETKLMRCTPLGKTFERIYPTAFNLMLELKRKKGFLWIGHELQRRESSLVINTVCEALRVDLPEVPVLTVHDSLLVPREHLGHVRALLDNAFQRYVMPPSFKIKEPVQ